MVRKDKSLLFGNILRIQPETAIIAKKMLFLAEFEKMYENFEIF